MRCGGCGAKVGATALAAAMAKVAPLVVRRPEVLMGVDSPDDCAVVAMPRPPASAQQQQPCFFDNVHTVDFFRSFYEDPYVFGQVAAHHALSDCHAMAAQPVSALAIAVLPFGLEAKVGEALHQMMAGACAALAESGCALVGGHTCEGAEMALGFSVNGVSPAAGKGDKSACLRKGGMRAGDALVLTQVLSSHTASLTFPPNLSHVSLFSFCLHRALALACCSRLACATKRGGGGLSAHSRP
jgi:selenide, water dikinase